MRLSFLFSLFVCAAASTVLSGPIARAQQDEPDVARKLVSKVAPFYPDLARKLNLRGVVKLVVVIAPDGKVTSTEVMVETPCSHRLRSMPCANGDTRRLLSRLTE